MTTPIASKGVTPADIAALRENRAKKTETVNDAAVESAKKQKPAHPAHPKGPVPPGLERAAEKIASKIFARADVDDSGTVTQEELSAVHSRHARTLAASDLFATATNEVTPPTVEEPAEPTGPTTESGVAETESNAGTTESTNTATGSATDTTNGTPAPTTQPATAAAGLTEAQLKEALVKSFYAKVGVTWTRPTPATPVTPPTVEEPAAAELENSTVPPTPAVLPVADASSDETDSERGFSAVA